MNLLVPNPSHAVLHGISYLGGRYYPTGVIYSSHKKRNQSEIQTGGKESKEGKESKVYIQFIFLRIRKVPQVDPKEFRSNRRSQLFNL